MRQMNDLTGGIHDPMYLKRVSLIGYPNISDKPSMKPVVYMWLLNQLHQYDISDMPEPFNRAYYILNIDTDIDGIGIEFKTITLDLYHGEFKDSELFNLSSMKDIANIIMKEYDGCRHEVEVLVTEYLNIPDNQRKV